MVETLLIATSLVGIGSGVIIAMSTLEVILWVHFRSIVSIVRTVSGILSRSRSLNIGMGMGMGMIVTAMSFRGMRPMGGECLSALVVVVVVVRGEVFIGRFGIGEFGILVLPPRSLSKESQHGLCDLADVRPFSLGRGVVRVLSGQRGVFHFDSS